MNFLQASIEDQLRNAVLEGEISPDTTTFGGYIIKIEPWTLCCFTQEDIKKAESYEDPEKYLEGVAESETSIIEEQENWSGSIYLYPDESGDEYGTAVFFKAGGK